MARSRPIVVEFTANVRDFLRKTKDVERSTEDIADELEKAEDAAGDFEDSFTRAMKDAERQAERSGRDIGDSFDGVDDQFGEVGAESGSEFKQNLAESLASGGSVEDIVQDTLAGLVGSLKGPVGAAAAALAGVGVLAFQAMRERAEELQVIVEGTREFIQGQFDLIDGYIDQAAQDRQIADWITEHGEFLSDNKDILDELGISVGEYAAGILLGGDHLDALNDKIAESQGQQSAVGAALDQNIIKYDAVVGLVEGANREHDRGNDLLSVQREAYNGVLDAQGRSTAEAERLKDRFDAVAQSIRNLPDAEIQGRITWYNVGEGAKYLDRSNANYSPGHVSVYNNIYKP